MDNITRLTPHPDTPSTAVDSIEVSIGRAATGGLSLCYRVKGDISRLILPPPAPPEQTDDLWKSTCFELFVKDREGEAYREYNFASSSAWAAYDFNGYREDMRNARTDPPHIATLVESQLLTMNVALALPLDLAARLGLSAVIEEKDGAKSYWALVHAPGKPDFHHPACFAVHLPPPSGT